jgi:cytochrome c1
MRPTITIGTPDPSQQPTVEPLAVSALALEAHAKLLATEASTTQVAQLPFNPAIAATDTIGLDDPAIGRTVDGTITVVEHLIDQGLAVTRLEVAPYF